MQNLLLDLPVGRAVLLLAVPLLYLMAAAGSSITGAVESCWRLARLCAAVAVSASLLSLAWLLTSGGRVSASTLHHWELLQHLVRR